MLKEFKAKTYIGIGFGIFLTYFLYAIEPKTGSGFLVSLVGLGLSILSMVLFIWGCCCYAKGKGHHGAWGLLGLLFIPGLIILSFFRDMNKKNRKEYNALFETEDCDELFTMLIKREYWNEISPDIIKSIFENAKGDLGKIKTFIRVSELYNSVGNNFVELAKSVSRKYALQWFAITLYRLGSGILKVAISAIKDKDREKLEHCVIPADMAFTSSILCDPDLLSPYAGMALLYGYVWINKDAALEFCRKYKEIEYKLLNTPDEELSASELTTKKNLDPEEYRRNLKMLAEHSQHLLPDDDIEFDGETMRDKINKLEADLLQKA